jgi:hypothetical protein
MEMGKRDQHQQLSEYAQQSRQSRRAHIDEENVMADKKIIRVFPRRTRATPVGEDVYVGLPHMWTEADQVDISVTFDKDVEVAERLAREWLCVTANVSIGAGRAD